MQINDIITIISTLGFPICMCIALFWKMDNQDKDHKTEMDSLKSVVNDLSIAITKLTDKIEFGGK